MARRAIGATWRERYGPWAVVTGASDGIGLEMARSVAGRGVNVVLVARRRDELDRLAAELRATAGVDAVVVAADLATAEGVSAALDATRDLDVGLLVASAGFGSAGAFIDRDVRTELGMIRLNCEAVAEMTHHFARRFVARGRGGVVLLSSANAFQGVPYAANYSATKAWVQAFAEGLRPELAPLGVDVIACAPGPVNTGYARRAGQDAMPMAATPAAVARGTLTALGRAGSTVRPGWMAKAMGVWQAGLPRWVRVRIMGRAMRGLAHEPPG